MPIAYIAGHPDFKEDIASAAAVLEANGYTVPCKWWTVERRLDADPKGVAARAAGDAAVKGCTEADRVFVFLTDRSCEYPGALCEVSELSD